jgi:hypothetical protein
MVKNRTHCWKLISSAIHVVEDNYWHLDFFLLSELASGDIFISSVILPEFCFEKLELNTSQGRDSNLN